MQKRVQRKWIRHVRWERRVGISGEKGDWRVKEKEAKTGGRERARERERVRQS